MEHPPPHAPAGEKEPPVDPPAHTQIIPLSTSDEPSPRSARAPEDLTGLADHIVGYDVEAIDGHIGTIDEATNETTAAYLVVDTGPWIFGKKILLPAGIVTDIDDDAHKVFVNRSKEQVKDAPDYDSSLIGDDTYRDELASYCGSGSGFRD